MYFLSIIVPVYNVEKYLERCVNSLVEQDLFDKTEILLVDDGSTDLSGRICDGFSSKYENIITIHKPNGGLSDARNCALDVARGNYISFLDSDDLVSKTFIKDMYGFINEYNPDLINFSYVFEREENVFTLKGDKYISVKTKNEMIDSLCV